MIDEPEPRRDTSAEERPGATAAADAWKERYARTRQVWSGVRDGREDVVDLVADAVTTLLFGPAVGGVAVTADRTERQHQVIGVGLQ
jgi:hypothetical protein